MKFCLPLSLLTAAALTTGVVTAHAQMNLLVNGDFSDPLDTNFPAPGYAPTAVSIPGWVTSGGGQGVNTVADQPFAPQYYSPQSNVPGNDEDIFPVYAFIQGAGSITQTVNLIGGDSYTLSFFAALRVEQNGTPSVTVQDSNGNTIAGGPFIQGAPGFITNGFSLNGQYSDDFVPDIDGLYSVVLSFQPGSGDNAEDFAKISLIDNDAPALGVPEPSTYALLGIGALGLCFVRRRSLKAV